MNIALVSFRVTEHRTEGKKVTEENQEIVEYTKFIAIPFICEFFDQS